MSFYTLDPTIVDKTVKKAKDNIMENLLFNRYEDGVEEIDVTLDDLCNTSNKKMNWGK